MYRILAILLLLLSGCASRAYVRTEIVKDGKKLGGEAIGKTFDSATYAAYTWCGSTVDVYKTTVDYIDEIISWDGWEPWVIAQDIVRVMFSCTGRYIPEGVGR